MTRRTWLLLQHVDYEGPCAWSDDLARRGIALEPCTLWGGDVLPGLGDVGPGRRFEGVLAMGGPMTADDDHTYARLADERALLAAAARIGLPVIAVCLGSQLLAVGLGASLSRGTSPEHGIGAIDAELGSPVGQALFRSGPVLHWHTDAHGPAEDSFRLAFTAATPVQAFQFRRALGMQFHIELRPEDLATVAPHLPPELSLSAGELDGVQPAWSRMRRRILDLLEL